MNTLIDKDDFDQILSITIDYFGGEDETAEILFFIGKMAFMLEGEELETGDDVLEKAVKMGIIFPVSLSACRLTYEKTTFPTDKLFSWPINIGHWSEIPEAVQEGYIVLRLPQTIGMVPFGKALIFSFTPLARGMTGEKTGFTGTCSVWA